MRAIVDKSEVVSEFFDWLQEEHGLELCEYKKSHSFPERTMKSKQFLIAGFFNIDMKKIEEEKLAMIDELRAANETPPKSE